MKQAIITGPTGAIGMALIEYLCKKDVQVIAVVREGSERNKQIVESDKVTKAYCDLDEYATLDESIKAAVEAKGWTLNPDVLYHFAWGGTFGDVRNNMPLQTSNIQHTLEAVDAAGRLGCKTFIGAGSQAEYGRVYNEKLSDKTNAWPENGYGMAKLCAGQMSRVRCNQLGIKHIWFRVLSVYGPYDGKNTMVMSTVRKMLAGEKCAFTKGEQDWDYLYSEDAAQAFYLAGEKGVDGSIYCLGNGSVRKLREYIEIIKEKTNSNSELALGEVPYSEKQVMYLCADTSKLVNEVGFNPVYSFEHGIEKTIEWYKNSEDR